MTASANPQLKRAPLAVRLAIIALLAPVAVLMITSGTASELLRAVDFLAPQPGLSGLVLVFLAPLGFLLVLALGAWALAGLRRRRAHDNDA